jgi:hypothetical protein
MSQFNILLLTTTLASSLYEFHVNNQTLERVPLKQHFCLAMRKALKSHIDFSFQYKILLNRNIDYMYLTESMIGNAQKQITQTPKPACLMNL